MLHLSHRKGVIKIEKEFENIEEKFEKSFSVENLNKDDQSGERTFSGWLSTYGNADRMNDVFLDGAFSKAIAKRDTYSLLYGHNTHDLDYAIGEFKAIDKPQGVWIEATLFSDDKNADKVYRMLKSGALQEMSIGFGIENYDKDMEWDSERKGFNFKKAYIREGSVVNTPANPKAKVTKVKTVNDEDFDREKYQTEDFDRQKAMEEIRNITKEFK